MKRTVMVLPMLALLLSMALVSCDSMFTSNVFSALTHQKPSATDIAAKSPDQLKDFTTSAANMDLLAKNADLKAAALAALGYGAGQTAPTAAVTSDQQTSAIVAADIAIKTVPDAAAFSAAILGYVVGSSISTGTTQDVTSLVTAILPKDIKDSVAGGVMPQSFVDLISAFAGANDAYQALGTGVGSSGYATATVVSSSDKNDIAVNAVIAGLISAITPVGKTDTPTNVASALWSAILDPSTSSSSITIDPSTFDNLTKGTGATANLLSASSLGSLMGGKS